MRDSKRDTEVKKSLLVFRTLWEKARVGENSTETCILSYMKQITSPGSMHETGAQGQCTEMTLQDEGHMNTHG